MAGLVAAAPGSLDRALRIAVDVHAGQTAKDHGPKILHVLRVMSNVHAPDQRIVAVLHDVVEHGQDWTFDKLRQEGFQDAVIDAVDALTRREDEDFLAFAKRAAADTLARPVKIADLKDNLASALIHRNDLRWTAYIEKCGTALRQVAMNDLD